MAKTAAAIKKKIVKVPIGPGTKVLTKPSLAKPAASKTHLEARSPPPRALQKANEAAAPADVLEAPQKMDIDRFFAFCACSLKMEAQVLMNYSVELQHGLAVSIWPDVQRMCSRNLGKNEKWVPMHTVLGVHEFYVCERIHHAPVPAWNDKRRFTTMFIFRSHCKRELFDEVQLPFLKQESFWRDPIAAFNRKTPMEKAIKAFRAKGNALQTSCFLIIPERLVPDDDENIIINLLLRTQRLIQLADYLWPMVHDSKTSSAEKFEIIRSKIRSVHCLGETWVKMLTVVIDIALPNIQLLQDRCEVGIGASDPLRQILEGEGLLTPKERRVMEKRDPNDERSTEIFAIYPSIKQGIMAVKRRNKQLLQVTHGAAGSFDRAYVIAEKLCSAANSGKQIDALNVLKRKWLEDNSIKAPDLGYDKKMADAVANAGPPRPRNDGPTPMDALVKLRDKLMATDSKSSREFHRVLRIVEDHGRKHFKHLPLVAQQMKSHKLGMSCATLQVQLCEFRQFQNFVRQNGAE